ncbi:septum formation protein [Arboricoccus pini]|uniref:dTTP/UTP pyrophosphatase n=1 Tax=Arboricoccus pini TaxID=1963835 RepID=A0A212R4S7_9PROT|nr:Maf family protein [Arboricoccus pini]SNB67084.1 septum formation protein [Arboricoccus pini]
MTGANASSIVLGSSSPRRLQLLRQVLIEPSSIEVPDVDESVWRNEQPRRYAERMARAKLSAIQQRCPSADYILAADTVVACGRRILGKAETELEARASLQLLSGRRHRVYGGVAVASGERSVSRVVITQVGIRRLSDADIDFYIDSGEWRGKAGGYAIQGLAAAFVAMIAGSYTNVVGLPLVETLQLLGGLGWARSQVNL